MNVLRFFCLDSISQTNLIPYSVSFPINSHTGCTFNIVFFPYFVICLNSASSAAALVFYLPGVCTHTDTEGKQREARVWNILKSLEKTQYLMNTLY